MVDNVIHYVEEQLDKIEQKLVELYNFVEKGHNIPNKEVLYLKKKLNEIIENIWEVEEVITKQEKQKPIFKFCIIAEGDEVYYDIEGKAIMLFDKKFRELIIDLIKKDLEEKEKEIKEGKYYIDLKEGKLKKIKDDNND